MIHFTTWLTALWFAMFAPLNVQNYGAKGDGVTDDTNAINSALAAAHEQKTSLFFPAGTYLCNTRDASGNILTFNAGGLNDVSLYGSGATITTSDTGTVAKAGKLLYIYAFAPANNLVIKGLRFISTHPRTNQNTLGIFITGTGATNVKHTWLQDCAFSGFALDVQGQGIDGWYIQRDSFYAPNGHDDALYGSNASHPAVNLWFADNSNGSCFNVVIEHCWASGYSGSYPMTARRPMDGFIFGTGYGFHITHNQTMNFAEEHIFLSPPITNPATTAVITIDSNTIDGSLPAGITDDNGNPHKYNYGIRVDASHVQITHNVIRNCAWGILQRGVDYANATPQDYQIANNRISEPADTNTVVYRGAISINGHSAHQIPNVRIQDNKIEGKDTTPIKTYNLSSPTIGNNRPSHAPEQ
jgi:Pectate lyase superfamily protein